MDSVHLQEITFCKYQLQTLQKTIELSFPQLLQLRNDVYKLSSHYGMLDIIESDNFVLLFVADKQHLLYLDIPQLIYLRNSIDSFFGSVKSVLI
ncbi:hypothetical protein [Tenacibaculum geojense]|uniref:Uncharacterized protein n=1 Tax=Tenacibaculum geojense TaxID=915352 RepID=A0ABW3JWM0_9FLAO